MYPPNCSKEFCVNVNKGKEILTIEIGTRLAEERRRLKLSQTVMAEHGDISKMTQISYEMGRSAPDAQYLALVAKAGVDVLYVVMGMRTPPLPGAADDGKEAVRLDKRQQALLQNYDAADEVGKSYIEGTANLSAQQKAKRASGGKR